MELIFKWLNILFFKYLERLNLRVFVKSASFETLGLLHVQSNFSSLFKKLLSNHPELGKDFPKLSANIDVSCLFRYSLPLFKQDASMFVLSILFKRLLKQHFWSLSLTATISSFLLTLPRPIIEEKPNLNFLSLSISSTVATTFRTLVKVFISFFKSFVPEWTSKKIQFLLNTWLDIINNIFNCCTRIGFVLILAWFFLGDSGTCQMLNHRITKHDDTSFCWHWVRIWLICGPVLFWFVCWISSFSIYFVYSILYLSFCGGRILNGKQWKVTNRFKQTVDWFSFVYFQAPNVELNFLLQEIWVLFPEQWQYNYFPALYFRFFIFIEWS